PAPPCAAPVGRRRSPARDGPPLLRLHLPAAACPAAGGVQPDERRHRRLPGRGRAGIRADARRRRGSRADEGARLPVLPPPRYPHRRRVSRAAAGEERAERPAARGLALRLPRSLALEGRPRRPRARRPDRPRLRRRLLAVARDPVSAGRRAPPRPRRRRVGGGDTRRMNDDCLFCTLYREGDHVAATEGFVVIRDINPQAPVHLLVIPEHHIDSFREISQFSADEDKRMLDFIAEVGARGGWTDSRAAVIGAPRAGQTVFHLHWHIKGGWA